ncbi:MAG: dipeptidase [Chlorobiaceae bacterium]|nr:dipeptidase [Chlorobiaceae bacterium]
MRKIFLVLFTLITFFSFANTCTNILVTKGASKDGSTMVSYSADSFTFYGELYHFPAAVYADNAMVDIYEWDTGKFLGRIKQARETYNVVGNMNEHQVVIGETTFGGREELHNSKGVIDYGSLIYLGLQRSKTAREAIKIMTDLVNEYGYYSEGESFSIADPNEAWILEMIGHGNGNKGALWVALRIPDGYIAAHANHARIRTFPLNDPNNCLYASDLISFAKERGWFHGKDNEFSFSDTYAPLEFGGVRFCDGRVWSIFRRVNKDAEKYISYLKAENIDQMPVWIKPEKKLSVHDVMELMRDHFEGTEFDMTKGVAAGPYGSPYRWRPLTWSYDGQQYFNERPISTPQTGFSFIGQCRSFLPNEVGGVFWFGLDDTYMTVYTPMYTSISSVPYNYAKGRGSLGQFSWESAFWVFNSVSNFAYPKYSLIIDDIRDVQSELEGSFLANQEMVEKTALALLKSSRGEAISYLTKYSCDMGDATYKRWKKLGEELLVKYMDGVVKDEYFKPVNVGYPDLFKKYIVQESGEALKVKKLPGADILTYEEQIQTGNKQLNDKKYTEAKDAYKKALDAKPGEVYPKTQIEKIDKILSEMESLHKSIFTK